MSDEHIEIRSKLDHNKKVIALALNPRKDLTAFYKGLLPFLKGAPDKGYQIIVLTTDSPLNGTTYLQKEGFNTIYHCSPDEYKELDFVDCFIVWDYSPDSWRFPENSKIVTLVHYLSFHSPIEIVYAYGHGADYSFLIRGSRKEYAKDSRIIEIAASYTYPLKMLKKRGCLIPGGYPEVDAIVNDYHPVRNKGYITFCTTTDINNDRLLPDYGVNIISCLLDSFPEHIIIFRPTPLDRDREFVQSIEKIFGGFRNFQVDRGDLQETINKTKILISDSSGLKNVFTIVTSIPHIYCDFSSGKKYAEKERLGYKITNIEYLVPLVKQILRGETVTKEVIDSCQVHLGCSALYLLENISYILEDKQHPDWFYYENKNGWGQRAINVPKDYFPYIQKNTGSMSQRSSSLKIIDFALQDFPRSAFLLGIKAKFHFYLGEFETARKYLAQANAIDPFETAETMNIQLDNSEVVKQIVITSSRRFLGEMKDIFSLRYFRRLLLQLRLKKKHS